MCDLGISEYAMLAAAAASAAGSYMQSSAANDAAERQQKALNASLLQQDEFSRKAESKALENAGEYDMTKRTQRLEDARTNAGDSLTQSLVKSREEGITPEQAEGRVSDAFTTDRATKMANQFQKSVDMARLMGNMRGTQDMLGNEGIMNADYASQLATIGRNAGGAYGASQPGIMAAGKVDAGKMGMGALMQSAGTTALGNSLGSYFGGTSGPSPTMSGAGSPTENWIDSGGLAYSPKKSSSGLSSMFGKR